MDTTQKRLFSRDAYISMALGIVVVLGVGLLVYNYISAHRAATTAKTAQQTQQEQTQPMSLPKTYTVVAGDTLWNISETYLTSGYNWVDIQKANNLTDANTIEIGQTLIIPDVKPIQIGQIASGATTVAPPKSYAIAQGDSLWSIADKMYQSGYKWVDIAKANNLTDPSLIHSGNILTLP